MFRYNTLIDGASIEPGEAAHQTVNPARPTEQVGAYTLTTTVQLARVIASATAAQRAWARVPGVERGRIVEGYLRAVLAQKQEIARAVTLEQGKPLREALAEIEKGVNEGLFMCGEGARGSSHAVGSARPGVRNMVLRRPRGVFSAIAPWNFPAMTPLRKLTPALVFGNAVIMKPSGFTPAAACLLAEIGKDKLPPGLFNVILGGGAIAGALSESGALAGVSFTGSVPTGRKVYAQAAAALLPVQLELGGKNAAVVDEVDDVDACVQQIAQAAFMTAGQRCTAVSRVVVRRDIAGKVVDGLADRARAIVLGDGMADDTEMGPLANDVHWRGVREATARAIAAGARPVTGGDATAVQGLDGGYFFAPTVLDDVAPDSPAGQEEIFGPVISVIKYDTVDEAMAILNGVPFGLTSALFSNDNRVVQRFLDESENGMLHVNHGTVPDINMPFGGIKHSGVGPYSVGPSAAHFYTSEHAAYVGYA